MKRPLFLAALVLAISAVVAASDQPTTTKGADNAKGRAAEKRTTARLVHYTGQVKGVGFRATAAELARGYPVTGWVKNLADGRVELLVEGPEEAVKAFLKAVHSRWRRNITKEQVEERPAGGKCKTFEVVR